MDARTTRRGFLAKTAAAAVAAAVTGHAPAGAVPGIADKFEPQEKPFMDQYYDGIIDIATGIRSTVCRSRCR